jgi:adenosylhomocysteine nucleosidase
MRFVKNLQRRGTGCMLLVLCVIMIVTKGCNQQNAPIPPLLIQGAMEMETDRLILQLHDVQADTLGPWHFWQGTIDGFPVVISKTKMGAANAAAATAVAIERYHPVAIINQGTSGGHDASLQIGDIVIGTSSVNVGAFKTSVLRTGEGSNSLTWQPIDPVRRAGETEENIHLGDFTRTTGDSSLAAIARQAGAHYKNGHVVAGVIGSSDIWTEELDRIAHFRKLYGTLVEEMETAHAAQIARFYNVPFLGIRIVSNNILNKTVFEPKTAGMCQDFVIRVIQTYSQKKQVL